MINDSIGTLLFDGFLLQFGDIFVDIGETPVTAVATYFVYVFLTLVFGGFIVLVAGERVRRLEIRIRNETLRAAGVGFGGIVIGVTGFALFATVFFMSLGAPDALALLVMVPIAVFSLLMLGLMAIGVIIGGLWLLRTVKQQPEPNLWVALVVGAIFVNIAFVLPVLNIIVGFVVILLPAGGLLDGWVNH